MKDLNNLALMQIVLQIKSSLPIIKIGGVLEQGNPGANEEGRRAHKEERTR